MRFDGCVSDDADAEGVDGVVVAAVVVEAVVVEGVAFDVVVVDDIGTVAAVSFNNRRHSRIDGMLKKF